VNLRQWDRKSDVLVAAFQKSDRQQVYVRLHVYEGNPLIDVRVWYEDKQTGEWKPSPRGIAVSVDLYDELRAAIEHVEDFI
jgi:hypothetical protein